MPPINAGRVPYYADSDHAASSLEGFFMRYILHLYNLRVKLGSIFLFFEVL